MQSGEVTLLLSPQGSDFIGPEWDSGLRVLKCSPDDGNVKPGLRPLVERDLATPENTPGPCLITGPGHLGEHVVLCVRGGGPLGRQVAWAERAKQAKQGCKH